MRDTIGYYLYYRILWDSVKYYRTWWRIVGYYGIMFWDVWKISGLLWRWNTHKTSNNPQVLVLEIMMNWKHLATIWQYVFWYVINVYRCKNWWTSSVVGGKSIFETNPFARCWYHAKCRFQKSLQDVSGHKPWYLRFRISHEVRYVMVCPRKTLSKGFPVAPALWLMTWRRHSAGSSLWYGRSPKHMA